MTTTVSKKGQVVPPAEFRRQDRVKAGQKFEVERIGRGEYRLKRKKPRGKSALTLERFLAQAGAFAQRYVQRFAFVFKH